MRAALNDPELPPPFQTSLQAPPPYSAASGIFPDATSMLDGNSKTGINVASRNATDGFREALIASGRDALHGATLNDQLSQPPPQR